MEFKFDTEVTCYALDNELPERLLASAAGIAPEDLLRRARGNYRAAARKVFAFVCCREYGFTIVEVAQYLGHTH